VDALGRAVIAAVLLLSGGACARTDGRLDTALDASTTTPVTAYDLGPRTPTRPGPEPTWVDADRCLEPCASGTQCVLETRADGLKRAACRARCATTDDCPAPEVCGDAAVSSGYCTNDRWTEVLEIDCIHPATAEPHAQP
jgi:hypothetical protein